jgi:LysM repeat protein
MVAMTRRITALLLALALTAPNAGAVAFNDVLPGARAMGMGTAYSAIADDAFGLFYNPAGTANTPYVQGAGTIGRMLSPKGPLFFATGVYLRPYEPINTATIGAAYNLERQRNGGDIDTLLFNYGQELKVRELPLSKPLKLGANVKIVNSDAGNGSKAKFGLGFDAGVIARSNMGLSAGLVFSDFVTALAFPRPGITLATAYTWERRLTLAGDFRVRGGLAEFYPGIEASFHQGLLRVRAGKGLSLDGVSTFAFGLGLNLSPMVLDVAMSLPTAGLNRQGGGYQASFSYRFGAPSFTGQFIGRAAAEAETLRVDVSHLEQKQKTMAAQAGTAEENKVTAESQLRVLEKRVAEANDEYRALLKRNEELEYRAAEKAAGLVGRPKPVEVKRVRVVRPPSWPKRHTVKAGDTLRTMAKQYYGDPNQWERIYDANREKVERGLPSEGAILLIPAPAAP